MLKSLLAEVGIAQRQMVSVRSIIDSTLVPLRLCGPKIGSHKGTKAQSDLARNVEQHPRKLVGISIGAIFMGNRSFSCLSRIYTANT